MGLGIPRRGGPEQQPVRSARSARGQQGRRRVPDRVWRALGDATVDFALGMERLRDSRSVRGSDRGRVGTRAIAWPPRAGRRLRRPARPSRVMMQASTGSPGPACRATPAAAGLCYLYGLERRGPRGPEPHRGPRLVRRGRTRPARHAAALRIVGGEPRVDLLRPALPACDALRHGRRRAWFPRPQGRRGRDPAAGRGRRAARAWVAASSPTRSMPGPGRSAARAPHRPRGVPGRPRRCRPAGRPGRVPRQRALRAGARRAGAWPARPASPGPAAAAARGPGPGAARPRVRGGAPRSRAA